MLQIYDKQYLYFNHYFHFSVRNLEIKVLEDTHKKDHRRIVDLQHLTDFPNLRQLWIIGSKVQKLVLLFSKNTTTHLFECTNLHIKLRIYVLIRFREFISSLVNLQVLDISESPSFLSAWSVFSNSPLSNLFGILKASPIQAVSLRRVQSFSYRMTWLDSSYGNYLPYWNIHELFSDFFKESLTYLDLSQNSIQGFNRSFIIAFPQLKVLDISQNLLKSLFPIYELCLLHPSVEVIDMSGENLLDYQMSSIYPMKEDYLQKYNNQERTSIMKRDTGFSNVYLGPYDCSQGYKINDILTNHTIFADVINCQLKTFFNDSQDIPENLIPSFDTLNDPMCNGGYRIPIAPHLKQLKMKYMNFQILYIENLFFLERECLLARNFVSFDASHSYIAGETDTILGTLHKFGYVRQVIMKSIDIPILNHEWLSYLEHIESLIIGGYPGQLSDNLTLCSFIPRLKILDLSESKLERIPHNLFMNCSSLNFIDLSHNSLSYLPRSVINDLERNALENLLTVDLSNNMLTCLCHIEAHNTISWIHTSNIRFLNHETYRCLGHNGFEMVIDKNLEKYSELCHSHNESLIRIIFISLFSSIVFWVFLIILFLLHKYRYRIKTNYFKIKQIYKRCFINNSNAMYLKPVYDVYISSSFADNQFVQYRLLPELETKNGLKCCVPDRDFPGSGISLDLISEYMVLSKTALVVLSKTALSDCYTKYERTQAKNFKMRGLFPRRIIYVLLEDIVVCSDSEMSSILDSNVYIKLPCVSPHDSRKEKSEQKRFFDRIVSEIHKGLLEESYTEIIDDEGIELNLNGITVD